jgi:hypothetical protein
VISVACSGAVAQNKGAPPGDASKLARQAVQARLDRLQNVTVAYALHAEHLPDTPQAAAILANRAKRFGVTRIAPQLQKSIRSERFSFLNGCARFESTLDEECVNSAVRDKVPESKSCIRIFTPGRSDVMNTRVTSDRPLGSISNTVQLKLDDVIDVALGLRAHLEESWLRDRDDLEGLDGPKPSGDGTVEFSRPARHVPDKHAWYFDPAKGWALVRYAYLDGAGYALVDVRCSDFVLVHGLTLPRRVVYTRSRNSPELGTGPTYKATLTINSYEIGSPENSAARYTMLWPKGSHVVDTRTMETFRVESGDRTLTDEELAELLRKKEVKQGELLDRTQRRIDQVTGGQNPGTTQR